MSPLLTSIVLALAALAGVYWWDGTRLRRAAAIIDAKFKSLTQAPTFAPLLETGDIPPDVIERLHRFEAQCTQGLGFAALGRLREFSGQGVLMGVRTVLVDAERTISATFLTSHQNPAIAGRAFVAEGAKGIVCATDAKQVSPDTARITMLRHGKEAELADMLRALRSQIAIREGPWLRIDTMDAYLQTQQRYWHANHEARLKNGNIIDLDALRRLAPRNLSERRLRRVHEEIVRRNRASR